MAAESTQIASTEFTNSNLEVLFSEEQIAERGPGEGHQAGRDVDADDLRARVEALLR